MSTKHTPTRADRRRPTGTFVCRSARRPSARMSALGVALVACLLAALSSSALAATTITDRLAANSSAVEATSMPTGTKLIKVAVMKNLAGEGVSYKLIPASQLTYTPSAANPVVDLQAATSAGVAIGGWAGRKLTSAAPQETQAQREARELKEHEATEKSEREAVELKEREARERAKREAREQEEREQGHSPMVVSIDSGGWAWASAVKDVAGAVHTIRSSYSNYNSDSQMQLLAGNGVKLMPVFSGGSSIGAINRTSYASTLVTWFKRYGHGGTFWSGKTDVGATTAELLNEPGNPYFWSDPGNYSAYAALITTVHDALQVLPAADRPTLLVSYDGGYGGDSYGRTLVKAAPALMSMGIGWTVHPYGGHGSSSAQGNRARVTEAGNDTHQPVYVTEVGWPTATGKEATGDSLQWSETQQSTNITGFVQWARSLGYVADVTYFNYADYGTNNWYGIVDPSGTHHKLSYTTLHNLAAEG